MGQVTVETEELRKRIKELERGIKEAIPHVYRQQHYGRHKQDKIDAVEWMAKWSK
tara:strand:+ start:278 stop:442 length:165 start_codon:yes stop_codon:yes gene_type:complete